MSQHFCNSIFSVVAAGAALLSLASVQAQTVTVAKTGSPNYSSIQSAIDNFNPDPNPSLPNIIQITDSALYDEVVTINTPLTLEGTGANSPILAVQANAVGRAGSAGLTVKLPSSLSTGTVTLRNLTIIPSRTVTPASCAISAVNNNLCLNLDKVIVSGNDGTDLPISSTGLSSVVGAPAHVPFGDDGLVAGETANGEFEGDGVEVNLKDTVITHLRGGTSDGILIADGPNRSLHLADGNVISVCTGKGMDVSGDFDSLAPTKRNLVVLNSSFGIWFHVSHNYRNIRNTVFAGNQIGIYESTPEGLNATIEDCVVANNQRQGMRVSNSPTATLTMRRTTFVNPTSSSYEVLRIDGGSADLVLENCIMAGNGTAGNINCVNNLGTGQLISNHTAFVNAGPRSLDIPVSNQQNLSGSIATLADPLFQNMTDFTLPTFYDVASPAYANAATGNTPLAGGANYTGPSAPAPPADQVITVSKSGPAAFTTLQAALSSLTPDSTKNYIIQILDGSVYDEMLTMNVPATIIGTGPNRPILAVQANAAGFDNDGTGTTAENAWSGDAGLLIDIPLATATTCTIGLKNLIIIPSRTGGPVAAGIVNKANNFFLQLENLLVTDNNGSDGPLSTNGMFAVTPGPSAVSFKVSGGHIGSITNGRPEGDGVEVLMRNCTFTNIHAYEGGSWRSGFYMYRTYYATANAPGSGEALRPNAFRHLVIDGTSKFTFNNGSGLRTAASLYARATAEPIYVVGNLYTGLWLDMQRGFDYVNGAHIASNGAFSLSFPGLNEGVGSSGPRACLMNTVIANNYAYGSYDRLGGSTQYPTTFRKTTFANNGWFYDSNTIQVSNTSTNVINTNTLDTIIAGNGMTTSTANVINLASVGTFSLGNTAVVTNGAFALSSPPVTFTNASAVLNGTAATDQDPNFANTTDPFLPNFYAVQNPAYASLASDGGPLSGGSQFAPLAAVHDWAIY